MVWTKYLQAPLAALSRSEGDTAPTITVKNLPSTPKTNIFLWNPFLNPKEMGEGAK